MSERNTPTPAQGHEQGTFTQVTIRGTVRSKIRLAKSMIFVVASANQDAKKSDFPRFVAFDGLSELDKTFSIGDRVTVDAQIHTSKNYPEGTLMPISVTLEKTRLDAAFAHEKYKPDMNEVILRGILVSEPYAPNESTTLTTFETQNADGSKAFVRTICFGRAASAMKQKHKGQTVEAMGYIRTKPLGEAKDRSHTQSLVITAVR